MTARRKNQAQAVPDNRRGTTHLRVVPREPVSASDGSSSRLRSRLSRNVDFHPALYMLVGVAILTLVAFVYLAQVNAVGNANYTLQELRSEHEDLARQKQDLQLQIARAQLLTNIERDARGRLRMVPIDDHFEYLPVAPGPLQAQESGVRNQESGAGSQASPTPNVKP